ncbi:alpha/beta-hydrolase [Pholiota conissans]|uniref:Alpha/beta-hydrolase n=1 Tax=Pholiota conissans TaxID=109636 RepID=A0A9P6CWR0_9AGAR|nr:alpha/beta-hydrolase [Pholiota conissans]
MPSSLGNKINNHPISRDLYEDLVYYFKYATSAYNSVCPRPNGNTLVVEFSNPLTDVQGFVARDDNRREIVIALRGSASAMGMIIDSHLVLVPLESPGISVPSGTRVHSRFLQAWDSVAAEIILTVGKELVIHPEYSIVSTGHSLGGSLALLAAVSLRQKFKTTSVRTYSYGAPRTGNKVFSDYVNATFAEDAYRVVHGNDGVPTIISPQSGYHHHGIEYWQYGSPASEETTMKCDPQGEDPEGSASIPSQGINVAHMTYFGITVGTPFCL